MTTVAKVTKVGLIQEYFTKYQMEVAQLSVEGATAFRQKLSRLPIDELARDTLFRSMLREALGGGGDPRELARDGAAGQKWYPPHGSGSGRPTAPQKRSSSSPPQTRQQDPAQSGVRRQLRKIIPVIRSELFDQALQSLSRKEYLLDQAKGGNVDMTGLWWPIETDPQAEARMVDSLVARAEGNHGDEALDGMVRTMLSDLMGAAKGRYEERIDGFCAILDDFFVQAGRYYEEGQFDFLARIALLTEFFKMHRLLIAELFASAVSDQIAVGLRAASLDGGAIEQLLVACAAAESRFYRGNEPGYATLLHFDEAALLAAAGPLLYLDLSRPSPVQINKEHFQATFCKDEKVDILSRLQPLWDEDVAAAHDDAERIRQLAALLSHRNDLMEELQKRIGDSEHPYSRKGWSIAKRAVHSYFLRKEQSVQSFCRQMAQYVDMCARVMDGAAAKAQISLKEEHKVFDLAIPLPALTGHLRHRVAADVLGFMPERSYEDEIRGLFTRPDGAPPPAMGSFNRWVETERRQYYLNQQRTLEQAYAALLVSFIDQIGSSKDGPAGTLGRELHELFLPKTRERLAGGAQLALQDFITHLISHVRQHLKGRVVALSEAFAAGASASRLVEAHVSSKLGLKVDLVLSYVNLLFPLLYVPIRINCSVKENVSFDSKKGLDLTVKRLGKMLADIGELMRGDKSDNIKNLLLMAIDKTHDYLETDRFFPQVVRNFGGADKPSNEPLFIYKANYDSRYVVLDQDTSVHRKYQKALDQLKAESVTRNYADYLGVSSQARDYKREIIFYIGPTNSGKSYEAFNLLVKGVNGVYLAPLRLLALEGKEEIVKRGKACNLVTGEEEELMEGATFSAQTIETIDLERHYEVGVIDEIQMIEDASRGWAWSQAFAGLNVRKLILTGSSNALPIVESISKKLGDSLKVVSMARKNPLVFSDKPFNKNSPFKAGTAIVAFTRKKILEIRDELVQHGHKVAVVYGALSPETRRLEAQRFRTGESTLLVSTDAIGMGLNLPISQVLFAQSAKFDGIARRDLSPSEVIQIGGRAGRFGISDSEDGVVGFVTGFCPHLEPGVLREGFDRASRGLDDVKCGYVVPNFAQVLEAKEVFGGKPLSMILKILATNIEFSEDWAVLCHDKMEDMIQKTRLLEDNFGRPERNQLGALPFNKLWKLISAPCDLELLKDLYLNLCAAVVVGSDPYYPQLPPLPVTKGTLERAEFTVKQLTIYSWFARRFKKHIPPGIDAERDSQRYFGIEMNGIFEPVERTDADREMLSHAISKAIKDERRLAPTFGFGRPR